jgi:hypothetical protein
MAGTCSNRATRRRPGSSIVLAHVVSALLLLAPACARHSATGMGDNDIVLVVENHHWTDVVVSVLHDGVVERIGLVTAVKTSTLTIPSRRLGPSGVIQLRAHAVGGPDDHTSDSFPIRPGQEITWTLESDLAGSSVAVH